MISPEITEFESRAEPYLYSDETLLRAGPIVTVMNVTQGYSPLQA